MSSEVLLSNIIPFAGSGLVGYAIGFALKKILKWMLIIVGFLESSLSKGWIDLVRDILKHMSST